MLYTHTKEYYTAEKSGEFVYIRLKKPPFVDVVYKYNSVEVGPANPDGTAPCNFAYDITEWPDGFDTEIFKGNEFIGLLGEILLGFLEDSAANEQKAMELQTHNHSHPHIHEPPPPPPAPPRSIKVGSKAFAVATLIKGPETLAAEAAREGSD